MIKRHFWACLALLFIVRPGPTQELPEAMKAKIDEVVVRAYHSAMAEFPCKIKTRGKPPILRWEEVDRCLSKASGRVDRDVLWNELKVARQSVADVTEMEFSAAVEAALTAHAVGYENVFSVKNARALLPLTNSLLKYMAPNSLQDVAVFDKAGERVGTFAGLYSYERVGGLLTANTYRLALFQYKDLRGQLQVAADKLLLDSYGVPWQESAARGAFRLSLEEITSDR